MKRIIMMLTVAALLVAALTVTSAGAFAVSPSQQACEDAGGTFTRTQGEVTCVITTVDEGKPHPQDKFEEETTTTEKSRGTLKNEPQEVIVPDTSTCSDTGSGKCPPGQFPD